MELKEKKKDFIEKLQSLSENKKKVIFFSVIAVSIIVIGAIEVMLTKNSLSKIGDSLKSVSLPKVEIPQDERYKMPSFDDVGTALDAIGSAIKNVSESDLGALNQGNLD